MGLIGIGWRRVGSRCWRNGGLRPVDEGFESARIADELRSIDHDIVVGHDAFELPGFGHVIVGRHGCHPGKYFLGR